MPIFLGLVAVTVLGYSALKRMDPRRRAGVIHSLNEFSALSGLLNRGMTTIDATRQLAVWIDSWDHGKNGEVVSMPQPPIGVPVPVKTAGPPAIPVVPPAPRPPASAPSHMVDMTEFTA